ncbi:MAG: hypothetical protein ACOYBQ_10350 [Fluviibacter sp.]
MITSTEFADACQKSGLYPDIEDDTTTSMLINFALEIERIVSARLDTEKAIIQSRLTLEKSALAVVCRGLRIEEKSFRNGDDLPSISRLDTEICNAVGRLELSVMNHANNDLRDRVAIALIDYEIREAQLRYPPPSAFTIGELCYASADEFLRARNSTPEKRGE